MILLVDAARLYRGEVDGLFQPIHSKLLEDAIPSNLRAQPTADGISWFGLSTRARVIVYNKAKVQPADVQNYESLADPKFKGQLCIRSGSHPYNLSLFGTVVEHMGDQKAEGWIQGMKANLARPPKGGDTDQIKAVASGECTIGVTNSYYLARMMRSGKPEDQAVVGKIGVVFPNQSSWGTHLNIAGGAVARHAKNKDNAVKFLEYLASPAAQNYFANGNNEWPAAKGVELDNPALKENDRRQALQERDHPDHGRGQEHDQGPANAGPCRVPVTPIAPITSPALPGFFLGAAWLRTGLHA